MEKWEERREDLIEKELGGNVRMVIKLEKHITDSLKDLGLVQAILTTYPVSESINKADSIWMKSVRHRAAIYIARSFQFPGADKEGCQKYVEEYIDYNWHSIINNYLKLLKSKLPLIEKARRFI